MADYNTMELMICTAARELEDGASVGVGTGAPCAAAMLAQKAHSPNLVILFEAGGAAPLIPEMPISVGDSRTTWKAVMASGMCEIMETACRGMLDYTFLGGAQIDMYGNLNRPASARTTRNPRSVSRAAAAPTTSPPSAGDDGHDAPGPQALRREVQLHHHPGGSGRRLPGQERPPLGAGPYKIITNMAVMDFEPESKRMRLIAINPGYAEKDVQDNCGFELLKAKKIVENKPPTKQELHFLRDEIDPYRYVIGR
jgi:glutaconate CoA-transferase subunit B